MTVDCSAVIAAENPPPGGASSLLDQLVAAVGTEGLLQAVAVGAGLADRAGDLFDALTAISDQNTAKDAIEIVTDVALDAALTTPT